LFFSFFVGFSIQVSPALLGFVELASIIAEFSCYCKSCDRNWS
jgi:hypothetical protein